MSKSFRDKERIKSKKAHEEFVDALNSFPHDDINQYQEESKTSKEIHRYGNKRKSIAKDKVLKRRAERRNKNDINYD